MTSPHLLRPFSSRQLSLVAGDGQVMVFAVLGGRFAGPSVEVHVPTLIHRIQTLPRHIHTLVFVDEPVPDAAVVALVDDMVDEFLNTEVDVLCQQVAANEAVKRVTGDRVVEGIDRSALVAVRAPEVIRRDTLERAVAAVVDRQWVNPTALVAGAGGRIRFYISHAPLGQTR